MNRSGLSPSFRQILILFVSSRLMMLAAFTPDAIITYGDYQHYFNLANLSKDGLLPFLDYWYEFPPFFPFLSIGIYRLTAANTGVLHSYVYGLAVIMLLFDVGNLVLLYRLAKHLKGERVAEGLSWVYLALPVGMIYTWRTFDSMTTFWILLALYWLMVKRENRSALALGLGVMTKYMPIFVLPAVWVARPWKITLRYSLIVLAVSLLILGPFLLASPQFTVASLKAQLAKSSWQTVWALIDGNLITGNVAPILDHFDPETATQLQGQPDRIPTMLTLLPFAAVGLYAFWKSWQRENTDSSLMTFIAFTFALFLLWSKGWSPQWQMMLFPLLLLVFPGRNGVLFCVLFGLINFLEWPVLLSRGMTEYLWLTVSIRSIMLMGVAVALGHILLRPAREPDQ